jgi:hypothetical protein
MRVPRCAMALAALWLAGATVAAAGDGGVFQRPEHPERLVRADGRPAVLCGAGDPEDFLYRGRRMPDGTRQGDQEAIIRRLAAHGGNCLYLQVVRSHGGDGRPDHNPFVGSNPARGLSEPILAQWERWFRMMDRLGVSALLFLYDDSARIWSTGDAVGEPERAFVEALARRFRHVPNLVWIVGEEAEEAMTPRRCQALAALLRTADRPGRVIGNHHWSGTDFPSWVPGGDLSLLAMQCNVPPAQAHARALEARRRAGGRYAVLYAENTELERATTDDARRFLWGSAMAGVWPLLYGIDVVSTPPATLRLLGVLRRFFEEAALASPEPADDLAFSAAVWALRDARRGWVACADGAEGPLGLRNLPPGVYRLRWVDAASGRTATERRSWTDAGDRLLVRPAGIGPACAVWLRRE